MIEQTIGLELIKSFKGIKLEKITILQRCLHNVCVFSNYLFKDFEMVN